MQNISGSQASPEIPINENFELLSCFKVYGRNALTTNDLTWGYWGGRWGGIQIPDGTLTLVASTTNYISVNRFTGSINVNQSDVFWNSTPEYLRVYLVQTGADSVLNYEDHRVGPDGLFS